MSDEFVRTMVFLYKKKPPRLQINNYVCEVQIKYILYSYYTIPLRIITYNRS